MVYVLPKFIVLYQCSCISVSLDLNDFFDAIGMDLNQQERPETSRCLRKTCEEVNRFPPKAIQCIKTSAQI